MREVDGISYDSYYEAAIERGLVIDENVDIGRCVHCCYAKTSSRTCVCTVKFRMLQIYGTSTETV